MSNQARSKKDGVHYMGIFINMAISHSTTRKEWEDVYQETLQLVEALPLAERREVSVRGIPTECLVPTRERETVRGWFHETKEKGWFADGDYEHLRTAECYYLWRNSVSDEHYEEDAPDALLEAAPAYVNGFDWEDERCSHCYSLWDSKTQGEPYHVYLLAVACLIESRLGKKAYVYGDITKGQCERAVRLANKYLDKPISTPDQCDAMRFLARVDDLPVSEMERLKLLTCLYLGKKDAEFGKCIRDHFSNQTWNEYWADRFSSLPIKSRSFDQALEDYFVWGFDLEALCSFVCFEDKDGVTHYEDFVNRIMDAKLHLREKDCGDVLKVNPDEESPYGIATLFAQFMLAGARNRKIDRYIPIDEIRSALIRAIGEHCAVNELIDAYLEQEQAQELPDLSHNASDEDRQKAIEQDPSYVLSETMKAGKEIYRDLHEEFDICESEDLPYYEAGDTIRPEVMTATKKSFAFWRSALDEHKFRELMTEPPKERCKWLANKNRYLQLRDIDWERIFDDIVDHPESFERYYPMVRVVLNSDGLYAMARAFVTNDALYSLLMESAETDTHL